MKQHLIETKLATGNAKRRLLKRMGLLSTGTIAEVNEQIQKLTYKQLKTYL